MQLYTKCAVLKAPRAILERDLSSLHHLLLRVQCQKRLAAMNSLCDAFLKSFIVLSQFVHSTSWSVNSILLLPSALFPTSLQVTAKYSSLSFLIMCPKEKKFVFSKCLTSHNTRDLIHSLAQKHHDVTFSFTLALCK